MTGADAAGMLGLLRETYEAMPEPNMHGILLAIGLLPNDSRAR